MTDASAIARPQPVRDRWGRYILAGDTYTRVTTITKTLSDTHALTGWKQRMVAHGLAQRPDLVALAATSHPDNDRRQLDQVVDQALEAAASAAGANRGTALHQATETIDQGGTAPELPGDLNQRIALYTETIHNAGIRFDTAHIEQIVAVDNWGGDGTAEKIAGTVDRVAVLADGRRMVADLKTGRTLQYSQQEIAMQLGLYQAHDRTYDPGTDRFGKRIADLDPRYGLVIHLPSSTDVPTCHLHLVDLAAGLEAVDYALWVRGWRKRRDLFNEYSTTPAPPAADPAQPFDVDADVEWLRWRIKHIADNPKALMGLRHEWPVDVPKPLPDRLTVEQGRTLAAVCDTIETRYQLPLHPYTNPPGTPTKPTRKGNPNQ